MQWYTSCRCNFLLNLAMKRSSLWPFAKKNLVALYLNLTPSQTKLWWKIHLTPLKMLRLYTICTKSNWFRVVCIGRSCSPGLPRPPTAGVPTFLYRSAWWLPNQTTPTSGNWPPDAFILQVLPVVAKSDIFCTSFAPFMYTALTGSGQSGQVHCFLPVLFNQSALPYRHNI